MNYQKIKIENYPNYSVDTLGIFRNEIKNRILKNAYTPSGYGYVALINDEGKCRAFAHVYVAKSFLKYFEGCHVHHKDGDSKNNKLENLECLTPFEHRKITKELNQNNLADLEIDQYTLDGVYVNTYISIMEASRRLKIDFRNISACILGKQKSCKGYVFLRKGEAYKGYSPKKGGRKMYKVGMYDIDGSLIKEYNSLHEAYLDSGLSKALLNKSILHGTKYKGKLYWSKID